MAVDMSKIEIGFEWSRGFDYEWVPCPKDKKVLAIRQVGRRREVTTPLEIESKKPLCLRFAEIDETSPDQMLNFARSWGLLENEARDGALESGDGWRREIRKMRGTVSMLGAKSGENAGGILRARSSWRPIFEAAKIDVLLSGSADARPRLILRPHDLKNALWLQLATTIAAGKSIRQCAECSEWFYTGIGGAARRTIAIFCSVECKNRHHYKHRKATS
jgi:hypothetical protein